MLQIGLQLLQIDQIAFFNLYLLCVKVFLKDDLERLVQTHFIVDHQVLGEGTDDLMRKKLLPKYEHFVSFQRRLFSSLYKLVDLGERGKQALEARVQYGHTNGKTRVLFGAQTRQLAQCLSIQVVRSHIGHVYQILNAQSTHLSIVFYAAHAACINVLCNGHKVFALCFFA